MRRKVSAATLTTRVSSTVGLLEPHNLRYQISQPFDFQHLTHTNEQQATQLSRTAVRDLSTEFACVRNSSRPTEQLKGILADDLVSVYSMQTELSPGTDERASYFATARNTGSRQSQRPTTQYGGPRLDGKLGGFTRSVDDLRQLSIDVGGTPRPFILPPRSSSRKAVTVSFITQPFDSPPQPRSPTLVQPDNFLLSEQRALSMSNKRAEIPHYVPSSALSEITSRNSPWPLLDGTHSKSGLGRVDEELPCLMEVEEEDEAASRFDWVSQLQRTPSVQTELASAASTTSLSSQQAELVEQNAFPALALCDVPSRPVTSTLQSSSCERNWEDDVDFAYEHALEANDGYDWTNAPYLQSSNRPLEKSPSAWASIPTVDLPPVPEKRRKSHRSVKADPHEEALEREWVGLSMNHPSLPLPPPPLAPWVVPNYSRSFRPSLLVPDLCTIPSLEQDSAVSNCTDSTESVCTPVSAQASLPFIKTQRLSFAEGFKDLGGFTNSPSFYIPDPAFEDAMKQDEPESSLPSDDEYTMYLVNSGVIDDVDADEESKRSSRTTISRSAGGSLSHSASGTKSSLRSIASVPDLVSGANRPVERPMGASEKLDLALRRLEASSPTAKRSQNMLIHSRSQSCAKRSEGEAAGRGTPSGEGRKLHSARREIRARAATVSGPKRQSYALFPVTA